MSTPVPQNTTLETVMHRFSSLPTPGMEGIIKEVESVKKVRYAFNPWLPHPNFGSDGFRFNIPYPALDRLVPIPLMVFQYPVILPRKNGAFAFLGASPTGAIPSSNSRSDVRQAQQLPEQSMTDLHTAYGKFGMVELKSIAASDEAEFTRSFLLFEAVMGPAQLVFDDDGEPVRDDDKNLVYDEKELDAGRRPADLLLEDFPRWLGGYAMRAYRYALSHGVIIKGQRYKVTPQEEAATQLIAEISASIKQAHEMALSPSIGILPQTRDLRNMSANKIAGGKNYLDPVDEWLLEQFPSFPMDTDVERARKALQGSSDASAAASAGTNDAIVLLAQQMAEQNRQAAEDRKLLMELLKDKKAK